VRPRTLQIASTGSEIVPSIFRRLFKNQHAATLIEYSLIAALIATATVTGMGAVGTGLRTVMASAANAMN
jgi:Flp pilus assembly pilin Flp